MSGLAPQYLVGLDFCQPVSAVSGRSGLRSSTRGDLVVVRLETDSGERSFAVAACTTGMEPAARKDQESSAIV